MSVIRNTRTSFIIAPLMVETIVAIRERMPNGENSMTYSVILSMTSLPSSMNRMTVFALSPRASSATPKNRQNTMICSMLALAMDSTMFVGNQLMTLSMKL